MYTMTPDYYREYIAHDIYTLSNLNSDEYLEHFGIKGMKWGHRKERISYGSGKGKNGRKGLTDEQKKKLKKGIAIGAGVAAGVGLATYGGYKLNKKIVNNLKYKDLSKSNDLFARASRNLSKAQLNKMRTNTYLDEAKSLRKAGKNYDNALEWAKFHNRSSKDYNKVSDILADEAKNLRKRAEVGKYSTSAKLNEAKLMKNEYIDKAKKKVGNKVYDIKRNKAIKRSIYGR